MSRRSIGSAKVRMPGTCGELVQGMMNGAFFHITCPVDLYSTVRVDLYHGRRDIQGPLDCPKAVRAVEASLDYFHRDDVAVCLDIQSPIPRGKGMASSTADVAGAIGATALALGRPLSPLEVGKLSLSVEPSDGTMFSGIALFDHREGRVYEELGTPPPMELVVLDFGGVVDTLDFNRVDRRDVLRQFESDIKEAVRLVRLGIERGDASLIGMGATISALTNQTILYKPQLLDILEFSKSVGAVGINVGHSGTVIGVLLNGQQDKGKLVFDEARRAFPELEGAYLLTLVGGGLQILRQ